MFGGVDPVESAAEHTDRLTAAGKRRAMRRRIDAARQPRDDDHAARCSRHLRREQPDRAGAGDEHAVPGRDDGRVEQAQVTESDAEVRHAVTRLDRLPLFKTVSLQPNREYYVRVRAEVRPRNAAFLWPWGSVRSAQTKFTFIP